MRKMLFMLIPCPLLAEIPVEGLTDRTVYTDRVSFRVPAESGFDYTVELDGDGVPTAEFVEVDQPEYHELSVRRREQTTGAEESRLIQFIVRASERANTEWGLSPWTPYPPIDSAAAECSGARLTLVAPREFPAGLPIPVVGLVEDGAGRRVGVNGVLMVLGHPLRVRRGVGFSFLPPAAGPGSLRCAAELKSLRASKEIAIETATDWVPVSGDIGASADWGENARIHVVGDLSIASNATVAVGSGSVIKLAPGADVTVNGTILVNGTRDRPVVFTPEAPDTPWGGFLFRSSASEAEMRGGIFTGSGADANWFRETPGSGYSHRQEQSLFYLSNGAHVALTDCYVIDNKGQAGHGESSFLTMTRCLIQKATTAGQYNYGSVRLEGCALIEFPSADAPFADADNDAIYLLGGTHSLTDCLFGWLLDDGIDAGGRSEAASVDIVGCWFESCYHEGMALSAGGERLVKDTVALNCGQGIECGFGDLEVGADHCLSTANLVGARFGDCYFDLAPYDGFLTVTGSLLLYNARDIWGRAWDDWTEHLGQMDIHGNALSLSDSNHPENEVWNPAIDAASLLPFLPAAEGPVGLGWATSARRLDPSELPDGLPVRLSTFSTREVSVGYAVDSESGPLGAGTLRFLPGETVKRIYLEAPGIENHALLSVTLRDPVNAEITGDRQIHVVQRTALVAWGSVWKYLDDGSDQGTAWRSPGFDDDSWDEGEAELGFGDGGEETVVDGGPRDDRHPTLYFRRRFEVPDPGVFGTLVIELRRDDGAVVYINGREVFRSNMPEGTVTHEMWATEAAADDGSAVFSKEWSEPVLVSGANVIAVEVHQATATSSDLSFDLSLSAYPALTSAAGFLRGDANGDGGVDLSDAISILLALFAGGPHECDDALDANDTGAIEIGDAISVLGYLFAGQAAPRQPFPLPGIDGTSDDLGCAALASGRRLRTPFADPARVE